MPGEVEAAEAPGAAVGETSLAAREASFAVAVARVFVPFAEFLARASVPSAAASAASSQHPPAAALISDVLDPVSVEASGVLLAAVRRAFAVLADISGPPFDSRCWEPLGVGAEEDHSDGRDGHWDWGWRWHWDWSS